MSTTTAVVPSLKDLECAEAEENALIASAASTSVTLCLDESGSMWSIVQQTVDGFNRYIDQLKECGSPITFSLLKFDTNVTANNAVRTRMPFNALSIAAVPKLGPNNYSPEGRTPLYDAIGLAIDHAEKTAAGNKVIIAIQTDGAENASREYSLSAIKARIATKQAAGWLFVFLGAGLDALKAGSLLGIGKEHALSYSGRHSVAAFTALGNTTAAYAETGNRLSAKFSDSDRIRAFGQLGSGKK